MKSKRSNRRNLILIGKKELGGQQNRLRGNFSAIKNVAEGITDQKDRYNNT